MSCRGRGPSTEPPRYLWVATVRVADGKMTEYAALAKRVRRAFDQHADGVHWLCYANAIGGEGSELVFYYGFEAFAEVDSWPSRREVLAAAHGERRRCATCVGPRVHHRDHHQSVEIRTRAQSAARGVTGKKALETRARRPGPGLISSEYRMDIMSASEFDSDNDDDCQSCQDPEPRW